MNIKQAFTLIELLVVIAIIGILSGLIVVSMNGITQKATIAKAQVFSNSLKNSLMMNMVSDWTFDGTGVSDGSSATPSYLADIWGQKNGTVTVTPPTVLSGDNCISGSCLNFNGSQYVSIADDPAFDFANQMTAMVWVKGSNIETYQGILGQYSSGTNNSSWLMFNHSTFPGKLTIELSSNGSTAPKRYLTSSIIFDGNWHLVGFTWNAGTLKLYVDGVEAAVGKSADGAMTTLYNSDVSLTIGYWLNSGGYFTGQVDEVRLYNAAIPASQIKEQYYAGLNNLLSNGVIDRGEYIKRLNETAKN